MNKKEVAEIRKRIKPESGCIKKIKPYFITPEKRCLPLNTDRFPLMTNEEQEHYCKVFKSVLSGKEGKKLHSMDILPDAETSTDGVQRLLLAIRDSELSESEEMEKYIQIIMDSYISENPYFILFLHGNYDVPAKASDDTVVEDSQELYDFIICCICPTKLSETGLAYNAGDDEIKELVSSYIIPSPSFGFLFPAFNDRSADIHSTLVYTNKLNPEYEPMFSRVLGCKFPLSEDDQLEAFSKLADSAFGGSCSFTEAVNVQSSLNEMLQDHSVSGKDGPLAVGCQEIASVFTDNYATDMDSFEETYAELMGDETLLVENLVQPKNTTISTDFFKITMPVENLHLISIREIDGIKCLVLKPNDSNIQLNGVSTNCE